jgi:hypothetical protein
MVERGAAPGDTQRSGPAAENPGRKGPEAGKRDMARGLSERVDLRREALGKGARGGKGVLARGIPRRERPRVVPRRRREKSGPRGW